MRLKNKPRPPTVLTALLRYGSASMKQGGHVCMVLLSPQPSICNHKYNYINYIQWHQSKPILILIMYLPLYNYWLMLSNEAGKGKMWRLQTTNMKCTGFTYRWRLRCAVRWNNDDHTELLSLSYTSCLKWCQPLNFAFIGGLKIYQPSLSLVNRHFSTTDHVWCVT